MAPLSIPEGGASEDFSRVDLGDGCVKQKAEGEREFNIQKMCGARGEREKTSRKRRLKILEYFS